jgi:hypothetical protein
VFASAAFALWTLCSALSTAACAVGTLPAEDVEAPEPAAPPAAPPPLAPAEPPPPAVPDAAGLAALAALVVCVGPGLRVVGVDVLLVVVLDEVVVVVAGEVVVPVLDVVVGVVLDVLEGAIETSETNSLLPTPAGWSDAFVVELLSAEDSWSCAAVRVCSA